MNEMYPALNNFQLLYYWFSIPHCCLQGGLPLCRCIIQETTIYYILISVQNKTALQSDVD